MSVNNEIPTDQNDGKEINYAYSAKTHEIKSSICEKILATLRAQHSAPEAVDAFQIEMAADEAFGFRAQNYVKCFDTYFEDGDFVNLTVIEEKKYFHDSMAAILKEKAQEQEDRV